MLAMQVRFSVSFRFPSSLEPSSKPSEKERIEEYPVIKSENQVCLPPELTVNLQTALYLSI